MSLENYRNRFFLWGYSFLVFSYLALWMINLAGDAFNDFSAGYVVPVLFLGIVVLSVLYVFDSILRAGIPSRFILLMFIWIGWMMFNMWYCPPIVESRSTYLVPFLWILCFLSGYYISLRNPRSLESFKKVFICFFIISIPVFIHFSGYRTATSISKIDNYTASINNIYFSMLTLPWIFLLRNKKWELLLFFVLGGLILISSKRSASIVLLLVSTPYIFFWMRNSKNRILNILLVIFGFLIFAFSFAGRFDYVSYRMGNIKESEGSGRGEIWRGVIKNISNSSVEGLVFGHGHDSVRTKGIVDIGKSKSHIVSAHNDFLEVIYDYGIIGLLLYISIYVFLFRRLWFVWKYMHSYFMSYYSGIAIMFVMAMVSHLIIYPTYVIILTTYWGAMEAIIHYQNLRINIQS